MWISVLYVDKCFICVVHAANLLTTGHGPKFSDRELEICKLDICRQCKWRTQNNGVLHRCYVEARGFTEIRLEGPNVVVGWQTKAIFSTNLKLWRLHGEPSKKAEKKERAVVKSRHQCCANSYRVASYLPSCSA
ncbi:hypothetical protein ACLKA6_016783 [Drosophila palustris]